GDREGGYAPGVGIRPLDLYHPEIGAQAHRSIDHRPVTPEPTYPDVLVRVQGYFGTGLRVDELQAVLRNARRNKRQQQDGCECKAHVHVSNACVIRTSQEARQTRFATT